MTGPRQLAAAARMAVVPRPAPLRRAPVQTAEDAQWTTRKGRDRGASAILRREQQTVMTASVRSLAPRLASTSARAAAPSRARRTGSFMRPTHRFVQLALAAHLHGRAVGEERLGDLGEVLHVRTEDDRLPEERRLEDVVSAGRHEAAADEHRRGDLIELRQLADRVEHDRIGARLGVDRQRRAADGGEPFMTAQPLDFAEALRMPRRQDEQRVAARRAHAAERADDRLFLPLERAAGHEHRPVRRDAEEAEHAVAPASRAERRRGHRIERVELQAAGDGDARRIGAELDEPPPRLLALHAERVDVGEHAPEERAHQPVPRERAVRDPAVDEDRLHAAGRHSRSTFGQISVSIITNSRGFTMSIVRRTVNVQSKGK